MSSFDEFFALRIDEITSEYSGHTLIFFKGFPSAQNQCLISHPMSLLNDSSLLKDGYIDLSALNNHWIDLVAAIKSANHPLVGFYEELLLISQFLNRVNIDKIIITDSYQLSRDYFGNKEELENNFKDKSNSIK